MLALSLAERKGGLWVFFRRAKLHVCQALGRGDLELRKEIRSDGKGLGVTSREMNITCE